MSKNYPLILANPLLLLKIANCHILYPSAFIRNRIKTEIKPNTEPVPTQFPYFISEDQMGSSHNKTTVLNIAGVSLLITSGILPEEPINIEIHAAENSFFSKAT